MDLQLTARAQQFFDWYTVNVFPNPNSSEYINYRYEDEPVIRTYISLHPRPISLNDDIFFLFSKMAELYNIEICDYSWCNQWVIFDTAIGEFSLRDGYIEIDYHPVHEVIFQSPCPPLDDNVNLLLHLKGMMVALQHFFITFWYDRFLEQSKFVGVSSITLTLTPCEWPSLKSVLSKYPEYHIQPSNTPPRPDGSYLMTLVKA